MGINQAITTIPSDSGGREEHICPVLLCALSFMLGPVDLARPGKQLLDPSDTVFFSSCRIRLLIALGYLLFIISYADPATKATIALG
jgi:hypothetical protein